MNISDLKQNSYVPYSGEATFAFVKSKKGHYFPGVRIENSAFPLTISAIQNALFCCLSEGDKPEILYASHLSDPLTDFWQKEYELETKSTDECKSLEFAKIIYKDPAIIETLKHLLGQALVANSQFPVAALLETTGGTVGGVNIENSNWSCGLCAERVALSKAIAYGHSQFEALHIRTKFGEYCSPCGACRQVIIEHLPHHPIHLHHPDGTCSTLFSSDLLPYSFQSSTLNKERS